MPGSHRSRPLASVRRLPPLPGAFRSERAAAKRTAEAEAGAFGQLVPDASRRAVTVTLLCRHYICNVETFDERFSSIVKLDPAVLGVG